MANKQFSALLAVFQVSCTHTPLGGWGYSSPALFRGMAIWRCSVSGVIAAFLGRRRYWGLSTPLWRGGQASLRYDANLPQIFRFIEVFFPGDEGGRVLTRFSVQNSSPSIPERFLPRLWLVCTVIVTGTCPHLPRRVGACPSLMIFCSCREIFKCLGRFRTRMRQGCSGPISLSGDRGLPHSSLPHFCRIFMNLVWFFAASSVYMSV